jgi:hypothetical protein
MVFLIITRIIMVLFQLTQKLNMINLLYVIYYTYVIVKRISIILNFTKYKCYYDYSIVILQIIIIISKYDHKILQTSMEIYFKPISILLNFSSI